MISRLHLVTGRDIMDHLIAGERSPKVLAQLARAAARRKIRQLEEAVEGAEFFTPAHAALLAKVLARIDRLAADIDDLSGVIEQLLAPYEGQLQQAQSMPGWGRRAAQDAIAETGVDMSRFRTGAHLVSWAAAPRWTISPVSAPGGPRPRRATGTWAPSPARPPWQPAAPRPAKAPATGGWPGTRRGQSMRCHREHPAEGLPQAAIQPRDAIPDLGPDYYERQRDTRRQVAHHVGKLGSLGFEVTLCRIPEPDPDRTGQTQAV